MIEYIKKRDGRKVLFDKNCITKAIFAAASEVAEKENTEPNYEIAEGVAAQVVSLLNKKFVDKIPTVEDIQDAVVKVSRMVMLKLVRRLYFIETKEVE